MPNMARCELMGHLGHDPSEKNVGGSTVVEFSLAVSEKRKAGDITSWYRCTIWGEKVGSVARQYLRKGDLVYVAGRLTLRAYQAKAGDAACQGEVSVDGIQLIGGHKSGEPRERATNPASDEENYDGEDDGPIPF